MTTATLFGAFPGEIPSDVIANLGTALMAVEDELRVQMRSAIPEVEGVGSLTLEAGGKRLRPALAVLASNACKGTASVDRLAKLGACLEMIHMATLVHDDVIDEAATRRGKPTASSVYGNTVAILSGDVLLAKAMQILADDGDLRIIRTVSSAVVELAEGEVRELAARGHFDLSLEEHLAILRMKTAAFIECCCRVGAMAADASAPQIDALGQYGHHVGMAFQVADDLLDFRGDKAKTGKPRATDFREGQATLPLIYLLQQLSDSESEYARGKFGNGVTDEDIVRIAEWMDDRGTFQQANGFAEEQASAAKSALSALPPSPERDLLDKVADFVVKREA